MPETSSTIDSRTEDPDENAEHPRHALASLTSANDPPWRRPPPRGRAAAVSERSARRPPSGASHAARPVRFL